MTSVKLRRSLPMVLSLGLVAQACGAAVGGPGPTSPDSPEPAPAAEASPSSAPASSHGARPSPSPASSLDTTGLRFSLVGWRTDFSRHSVDLTELRSGGPPKDGIPPVDEPRYETIADARSWLDDRSPVIAIVVGDAARAYPLAILTWHEIVNETLGGEPIVVTFCPLCNTALVFERTLDGRVLDFGTTGNLRFSDLVMYDRQTESWWQQATGEAIVGELTGSRLTFLPAQIVSLADFAAAHPDGDVLSRETGHDRSYGRNPYVGYDAASQHPFLYEGVVDGRLAPKERVVTVGDAGDAIAFPYTELEKAGVANETLNREPIVVLWTPGTASALDTALVDEGRDAGATGVFRRTLEGRTLTFSRDGGVGAAITDDETGSTWSVTGRATAGELEGSQLEPVVHGDHFWFAWAAFSPETRIWTASTEASGVPRGAQP